MTTQEFVKQEVEAASNQMFPIGNEHESKMIARQEYRNGMAYGLTKGLEIAKELIMSISGCKEQTAIKYIEDSLTEKYGK